MNLESIGSSETEIPSLVDPLVYETDIEEYGEPREIYCGCPCPKISAPIWAAGFAIFDPLG